MYTSNKLGNYGGLGGDWGLLSGKIEVDSNAKDSAKAMIKILKGQDTNKPNTQKLQSLIPKQKKIIGATAAMRFLTKALGPKSSSKKGKVYWTPAGPKFSSKPIAGGNVAEKVMPPVYKTLPIIKTVRDLPIPEALRANITSLGNFFHGDTKGPSRMPIFVLGLLLITMFVYNKP